jgi:uncharacterized protein with NAD-binding domain and iron-sulfur cluster
MTNPTQTGPVKVAVLGGGVAGLAAAFELSDPRHGGRFDVTLYQLGWRLGGKCASGRDVGTDGATPPSLRIQEHGPHIFFGFYDNAFSVLRQAYAELPPDPSRAFNTIEDALVPHNCLTAMEQQADGTWLPWNLILPDMPGRPGDDLPDHGKHTASAIAEAVKSITQAVQDARGPSITDVPVVLVQMDQALDSLLNATDEQRARASSALADQMTRLRAAVRANAVAQDIGTTLRRLLILFDLATVTAIGALLDGLIWPTPEAVAKANAIEYRAWLLGWGAAAATANSAIVRAMYDTVFAYPNGEVTQPGNVEAGSAVLTQLRLIGYRGPPVWKMRAGTGDVVAGALYQVLTQRGVKINFFSRVTQLTAGADGAIDSIQIGVQATLKTAPYRPLLNVKGVMAWPDRPFYDQLDQGGALQAQNIDLESYWTSWQPVATLSLSRANGDFDSVVLGIPVGALAAIAPQPLLPQWQAMLAGARTVVTQSVQLWLDKATGWSGPDAPIVTAYERTAVDTWLDESEVIPYENWSAPAPLHMAILCGPMPGVSSYYPPSSDQSYPAQMAKQVNNAAQTFLASAAPLWPALGGVSTFDWSALHAPGGVHGAQRLNAQYWVAAINPSDRYVLTPAGNSQTRLAPDNSYYSNLYLCGDWTNYGFNLGFFEGSVISGLLAANAITGDPRPIIRNLYYGD